jgi:hypothetical protein
MRAGISLPASCLIERNAAALRPKSAKLRM